MNLYYLHFYTHRNITLNLSPTQPSLSTSVITLLASSLEDVHLPYNKCQGTFPTIFYLGSSFTISFDKSYFVSNIRPLANNRPKGLANWLTVEGIGVIKWKLRTKSIVILVKSSCYYAP